MTTEINGLKSEILAVQSADVNDQKTILDFSCSLEKRATAFEIYYNQENIGDNAIDKINSLSCIYQLSGIKVIEDFLYHICTKIKISPFLKLEAAKALLKYEELEDDSESDDDEEETLFKHQNNIRIREQNISRHQKAAKALDCVCSDLTDVPTPCRVEVIGILMKYEKYQENANKYFQQFVSDGLIECEYRYKTILALEKRELEQIKKILRDFFIDKKFVANIYNKMKKLIKIEFPNFIPKTSNQNFFNLLIEKLNYDEAREILASVEASTDGLYSFFIKNAQLTFFFHSLNFICYRILSGQYLLQKFSLEKDTLFKVENTILSFANDISLTYNKRADAADVILRLGTLKMKEQGRNIIMILGRIGARAHTIFENAQNVHSEKVEDSLNEILEFFSTIPLLKVNELPINFEYVKNQIKQILKNNRKKGCKKGCKYQKLDKPLNEGDKKSKNFCSTFCEKTAKCEEKIEISLNRIFLDRALYSVFNMSLNNILLKVWSYLSDNKNEDEIQKRLLEELEEMSGTCSSGFAARLTNVISGFDDNFSIRISWLEQIVANFSGRLNAAARKITDKNSIFYKNKLNNVVELWLMDNKKIKQQIISTLIDSDKITDIPLISEIISKFLASDREEKVNVCVEKFAENVFNEMMILSSDFSARQNFALFFRSNIAEIREEMYDEFKEYIDDASFDLYMRKAIIFYEGAV